MWGEAQAGFEWQVELEKKLEELGWRRAENVPACWTYQRGDNEHAILVTIVDDLLFSETQESSIAKDTVEALSSTYGELSHEANPTSFPGYKLTHLENGAINLTMPQKIEEAAPRFTSAHLPRTCTEGSGQ